VVSFTNKTDRHDITEILLKVALNTINQTKPTINLRYFCTLKFKGTEQRSMSIIGNPNVLINKVLILRELLKFCAQ
jgi:hypothetical protein